MSRRNIIILLICLAAAGVRCWKIDAPFTDLWSWRQSDVAAIARNYLEGGFHFARPQIDWAGDQPGYVGTEFPILPFVAAIAYMFLGVHEWIGRIETVLLFIFSLPFFLGIVRDLLDEIGVLSALVFYCFAPLSIAAGRAFMPDVPSLSFAIAGMYLFSQALTPYRYPRSWEFWTAALLTSLALLIKITTVTIAAPMALLAWRKFGPAMFRHLSLWLFAAIALLPPLAWYWYAHHVAERFYPYHFFGGGGLRIMNWSWYGQIAVKTCFSSLTPVLFILAGSGVLLSRKDQQLAPFRWWLAAMILFIVIVGYGNRHQWYQLPLVPIAAVFGGVAISLMAKKWGLIATAPILILFVAFSAANSASFFANPAEPLWQLGQALRNQAPPNALIIAADDGDPTALYYAHRKGWHFPEEHGLYYGNPADGAQILDNLEELRQRGATHLVFYTGTMWWLSHYRSFANELAHRSVMEASTEHYRIYRLVR